MKTILSLICICLSLTTYSQRIKVKFIDENNIKITDVDLYQDDIQVLSSGKRSFVKLKKKESNSQYLVSKFGFKELIINLKNDTVITLSPSITEDLDLIEIKPLTVKQFLDSIDFNRINRRLYKFSNYMKIKKVLSNQLDTVFYLKEKYKFNLGKTLLNPQNKIYNNLKFLELKNPNTQQTTRKYYLELNKKDTHVPFYLVNYNKPISFPYNSYFEELIFNKNEYNYTLSGKGEILRIDFEPKKSKKRNSKKGYLIFNKYDYGIYEFYISQIPNKKNTFDGQDLNNSKNNIEILVNNHTYFVSYIRNDKETYDILRCEEVINFTTIDDNDQKLNWNNYRAYESTKMFELSKSYSLDDVNFKVKPLDM